MGILSKGKLTKFMLTKVVNISSESNNIKEETIRVLGDMLRLSSKKEIDAAWNDVKKKAVKEYPEKFILDDRGVLKWNDGSIKNLDKKITLSTYRKLNVLAEKENCSVDKLIGKLIKLYNK